jgi:hypothetical protein
MGPGRKESAEQILSEGKAGGDGSVRGEKEGREEVRVVSISVFWMNT